MSLFDTLELLPADPILGLIPLFDADSHPDKINLSIGSYKDAEGKPYVLETVKKAEKAILEQNQNKEYQSIDGDPTLRHETLKLIFGENSSFLKNNSLYFAQTVGASGALRIGAEFLKQLGVKTVALSIPSWSNHHALMERAGLEICNYEYYDAQTHAINFEAMCASLKKLPKKTVILLHTCCHNPTGMDPTLEQWKTLSLLMKECHLIPFFDFAYQGFNVGIDEDAQSVRLFAEDGHEIFLAYSFSKNFGLYGERIGGLAIVSSDPSSIEKIKSHVQVLIRGNYSSPPLQGARIIKKILTTPELKSGWIRELTSMRNRIHTMRYELVVRLKESTSDGRFNFIEQQKGMFGFLGLTQEQVHTLRTNYGIYMPNNGRISISGLTLDNLTTFVQALNSVFTNKLST